MIMYAIKKALPLMAVLLVIAGCSGGKKATAPKSTAAQPQTAATVTTAPTATTAAESEPYSYAPGGRRDPFTPIVVKEEKKAPPGATPLERYPVNEFKLAGIVWGGLGYHAVLEGPDGKGYFVRQGTIIGPNRGVVKKITQNSMIIEEKYKDPTGELNKHEIVIELRKSQEGTP